MTLWEYYKDKIKHTSPLDAFYNDSMELRESVVYAYDILNRKTPAYGTSHDWNAAKSAMSMVMDDFDKAFFKFMCSKESAEFYAVSASGLTGAIVDVDAGPCINEINSYQGDAQYVQAGITTLTSEYNTVYQDIMAEQTNKDEIDVQAWAEALDAGFATVQ